MRKDLLHAPHCLWCGKSIAGSGSTYFCSAEHSERQGQWVCRKSTIATRRCSTPQKFMTRYRGTALRWAVFTQKSPYYCPCGFFHLTSNPKSAQPYERSLRHLAASLHQKWPKPKVRLAQYRQEPRAAAGGKARPRHESHP